MSLSSLLSRRNFVLVCGVGDMMQPSKKLHLGWQQHSQSQKTLGAITLPYWYALWSDSCFACVLQNAPIITVTAKSCLQDDMVQDVQDLLTRQSLSAMIVEEKAGDRVPKLQWAHKNARRRWHQGEKELWPQALLKGEML